MRFQHKIGLADPDGFRGLLNPPPRPRIYTFYENEISAHARLFVDALWSPAGKGLTSWL